MVVLSMVFYYHMKLHYSQTTDDIVIEDTLFYYHMKLHYSQTLLKLVHMILVFYYHMKLHYSQTTAPEAVLPLIVLLPYEITLLSNLKSHF